MKSVGTDILFITYAQRPRDTGDPEVYEPLRMRIQGRPATLPLLRILASGADPVEAMKDMAAKQAAFGLPPVLTPIYMQEYVARRGLTLKEVPCLEMGAEAIQDAVADGVGVIALSTTWAPATDGAVALREAAAQLRALAPGVPIVAGGVGVRKGLRARALLQKGWFPGVEEGELARQYLLLDADADAVFDAIIYSEGSEATLTAMAERIRAGEDFRDLPNLALPGDGRLHFNPARAEVSDIDGEVVDWSRHADRLGPFEAPVRTALGCPFCCEFCDFAGLYKPKLRSLASLMAELRTLSSIPAGARRVFFTDDNVAINRTRLAALTRALIDEDLGVAWRAFVRADAIDEEGADLMQASGCRECLLGLESGDPQILANMDKRLEPERALSAVRLLDERGICTQCTFVVGFPGECAESIRRTADFISTLPSGPGAGAVHRYYMFPFHVAPLCPAASPEKRLEYGLEGVGRRWRHKTMDSDQAGKALRDIFLSVTGPSHMYLEQRPPDWTAAATRDVMELRDRLQKDALRGDAAGLKPLLDAVARAEQSTAR